MLKDRADLNTVVQQAHRLDLDGLGKQTPKTNIATRASSHWVCLVGRMETRHTQWELTIPLLEGELVH